jgi:sodium/potassium-transporting ATPase subunit alpha
VIGFCYTEFSAAADTKFDAEAQNFPTEKLCFLGIAAIMDPPRDDSASAISACKQAGIKVFMVTGTFGVNFEVNFGGRRIEANFQ